MESYTGPKYWETGFKPIPLQTGSLRRFTGQACYKWLEEFFLDPEIQTIEENLPDHYSPEIVALQMMESEEFQKKVQEVRELGTALLIEAWFPDFKKQADRRFGKKPGQNGAYYLSRFHEVQKNLNLICNSLPREARVAQYLAQELNEFVTTRVIVLIHSYLGYECRLESDEEGTFNANDSNEAWSFSSKLLEANEHYFEENHTEHQLLTILKNASADGLQWHKAMFTEPRHDTLIEMPTPQFSEGFQDRLEAQRKKLAKLSIEKQTKEDEIEFSSGVSSVLAQKMRFPILDRMSKYQELQQSLCLVETDEICGKETLLDLARCDGHLHVAETHIPFYYYFEDIEKYEAFLFEVYEAAIKAYEEGEESTELTRYQDYAAKQLRRTKTRRAMETAQAEVESVVQPAVEAPQAIELPPRPEFVEAPAKVEAVLTESEVELNRTSRFERDIEQLSVSQQEKVMRKIKETLALFGTGSSKGIKKLEVSGAQKLFRIRYGGRRIIFQHEDNRRFRLLSMAPRSSVYEQDLSLLTA